MILTTPSPLAQRGTTMIEVLVTIIILTLGLLGLAGLQSRLQVSEMEAYQRAQAVILLNDMASRLTTNRKTAPNYVTGSASPVGAGMTCPAISNTSSRKDIDIGEWCNALQGAAETSGSTLMGAMVGGRGCIEDLGADEYLITVAWQGLTPLSPPPTAIACGKDSYDGASGSTCVADRCRRVVTTRVKIAKLD
ncbi:type IV pilus modification protein PilV [Aromatoleum toluolicum]|nr:type IV pilus modification protein PilV [Aromatoleum toluolicum]NMF97276.2 type IV pilus modification protein PilV [Aromatoleum toluolicum]